jgi:hypothetical protein
MRICTWLSILPSSFYYEHHVTAASVVSQSIALFKRYTTVYVSNLEQAGHQKLLSTYFFRNGFGPISNQYLVCFGQKKTASSQK